MFCAVLLGCSGPDASDTTEVAPPGDLKPFRPLEAAMGTSCASLDCHGQPGRNLRLYDAFGLRLSPRDISGLGTTTDAEVLADERSFLGLEPDTMSRVLRAQGADPTRLVIVRKARGVEDHKGGTVWPEGSDGDRCLLGFLTSSPADDACARAAAALMSAP